MSLKPYSAYKDSGVPLLGEVPEHWSVVPAKRYFTVKSGEMISSDEETEEGFPIMGGNGIRGHTRLANSPANTLVIGRVGGLCGCVHFIREDFWASEHAYRVLEKRPLSKRFFYYLIGFLNLNQHAIRTAQPLLNTEIVERQPICVPDLVEQSVIAAFLDQETTKIDELIAEQEKLIALLAEKRQATISHAVTKGLNPAAPMKDSGVEWLGQIPAHWNVMPLGKITLDKCDGPFGSGLKSEHYTDEGARVIRLQNIRSMSFYGKDEAYIDVDYFENELRGHSVQAGDILIAGLGDERNFVGRACVAPADIEPALVKADCFRFRLVTNIEAEFVATQLSAGAHADAGILSSGSTRSRIPLSVMATRKLAMPPRPEQIEILNLLREEMSNLDALATNANRLIDLLKERRTALISATVTGKIDVREITSQEAA